MHPIEIAKQKLDGVGIPFVLMASTLLGIYRDGDPIGGIFEFQVLAEDMTISKIEELKKNCELTERTSDMGVGIYDIHGLTNNNFELHVVYFKDDYAFNNLSGDDCLVWPKYTLQKENWGEIEWNHKMWPVPGDIEKYLEAYYGKNWRTPQSWNWHSAPNYCKLEDIKKNKFKLTNKQ